MNREYHKWFSTRLQREMELLVFGHSGRAVLFFPTRMARFYDYENWGIVNSLKSKLDRGEIQLYCVDSIDRESFYNTHVSAQARIFRHLQYEDYLLHEVMPLVRSKNNSGYIMAAGCSMGAYHAVNFALKYPWLFKKTVGISGRYDLTKSPGEYRDLLDGHHSENVYFNMPAQYISNLNDEYLLGAVRSLEVVLAVGETDPFLPGNQDFSRILWNKGIHNNFHIWGSNAHRPYYWRQMVPCYL